jgi:PAS domain S-box-containing protein
LHDIDERIKAEQALAESEQLFRGIVESANDVIFTASVDRKISYISPNVSEVIGFSAEELVGRAVESVVHESYAEDVDRFFSGLIERGASHDSIELLSSHRDGSPIWFHLNASLIKGDSGEPQFFVGIAHDITERKQFIEDLEQAHVDLRDTQTQLVQSEKMAALGMLVAGIAHEINTPIGAVASMNDTMRRSMEKLRAKMGQDDNPAYKSLFQVIDDANKVMNSGIDRVTAIVRRLRSFARMDEAELKRADINDGIEDTLNLVHHEFKHSVEVVRDFGDVPAIPCFPGRLNQVFLNLLMNARQSIKEKGELKIVTRHENHHVVITISDSGGGIPPENLSRIFDPGFTTKGVGVGTGLGLSICYKIVEEHKGRIRVESEVGKGTTFTIEIPDNLDTIYGDPS